MSKILIISNVKIRHSSGSGQVISSFIKSFKAAGQTVELHELTPLPLPILRSRLISYRKLLRFVFEVILNPAWCNEYSCCVVFGAEASLGLLLAKKMELIKCPIVCCTNGFEQQIREAAKILKNDNITIHHPPKMVCALYTRLMRNAEVIVTNSRFSTNYALTRLKIPQEAVIEAKLGLAPQFIAPSRFKKKKFSILFCGSWIERKGTKIVKSVYESLFDEFKSLHLWIVGNQSTDLLYDFDYRTRSRIKLFGHIDDRAELKSIFDQAEVFMFPTYLESFGLVTIEAMSSRCVVITTNTGVACELRDNVEVLKIDPVSPEQATAKLRNLYRNRKLIDQIATQARTTALTYTPERFNRTVSSVLDKAMASTRLR